MGNHRRRCQPLSAGLLQRYLAVLAGRRRIVDAAGRVPLVAGFIVGGGVPAVCRRFDPHEMVEPTGVQAV